MLNLGVTCHTTIDVLPIINLSWHQHLCSCTFIHLTNIWVLRMWQRLVILFLPYNKMSLNLDKFICKMFLPLRFEISQITSLSLYQCPNSGTHNSHHNYITIDSQLVSLILLCPCQVWSIYNTEKRHIHKSWGGRTRKRFSQGIKDPIIFVDT